MPELPEVETTRRGLAPHVVGARVEYAIVRDRRMRWPVETDLEQRLFGLTLRQLDRRAKYLLFDFETGQLMIHLGMSGSLRLVERNEEPGKHDHFDLRFDNGLTMRFRDPRRFGSIHWLPDHGSHSLLEKLGPEPLSDDLTARYLFNRSRGRSVAIKNFIMDNHVVVGVGNIYATEALFRAGISPKRAAGKVALPRYERLEQAIRAVLAEAIDQGGTTLRDFVGGTGDAGYFSLSLQAYGREGEPCDVCGTQMKGLRLGQRATVYCPKCQR
ncbi:MAG: bifunctional DNA-formamidopyrimidine glycosylase/DNA-(apurinic or apyrimidinic site) lyase [Pseudomonadales bacterium]